MWEGVSLTPLYRGDQRLGMYYCEILAERIGNDTVTNKINPKHYSYFSFFTAGSSSWALAQSGLAQPAWTIAVTA